MIARLSTAILLLLPAVAFANVPEPEIAPAPTLGEAGLLGLAVILPLVGARALHRRIRGS